MELKTKLKMHFQRDLRSRYCSVQFFRGYKNRNIDIYKDIYEYGY